MSADVAPRARSVPLAELDLRSPEQRGQLSILDGEYGGWCET
jgi:hypothetical protein